MHQESLQSIGRANISFLSRTYKLTHTGCLWKRRSVFDEVKEMRFKPSVLKMSARTKMKTGFIVCSAVSVGVDGVVKGA